MELFWPKAFSIWFRDCAIKKLFRSKFSAEHRPKVQDASPRRLVRDVQVALNEQILNLPIAERETREEPNGVLDIAGGTGRGQTRSSCVIFQCITREKSARRHQKTRTASRSIPGCSSGCKPSRVT
jgi:hypothetical protein